MMTLRSAAAWPAIPSPGAKLRGFRLRLAAVAAGEMIAPVGLVQQVERAASAADHRHQLREQAPAEFIRLFRALQAVGDGRRRWS